MAENERTTPETDLRETMMDDGDDGDRPLSRRIRERTAALRERAAKRRTKRRVKKQSKQLQKQRRRRNLRESADNVVNAATGRGLDDLSPSRGEGDGDDDDSSFLDRFASGDGDASQDAPQFFDVDGDGDVDAVLPPTKSDANTDTGEMMPGVAPLEVNIQVDDATVEVPGDQRSSRRRSDASQDQPEIFPGFSDEQGSSDDDDDFPPLF